MTVDLTALKSAIDEAKAAAANVTATPAAAGGATQADVDELTAEVQTIVSELQAGSTPPTPAPAGGSVPPPSPSEPAAAPTAGVSETSAAPWQAGS